MIDLDNLDNLIKSTMESIPVVDHNLLKLLMINYAISERLELVSKRVDECDDVMMNIYKIAGGATAINDCIKSSKLIVNTIISSDSRFSEILKCIGTPGVT